MYPEPALNFDPLSNEAVSWTYCVQYDVIATLQADEVCELLNCSVMYAKYCEVDLLVTNNIASL